MTQRDWDRADAPRPRRVPQRRGDRRPHAARRADRRRLVPAALQRPPRGRRRSRCPPRRFGSGVDASSCARPTRDVEPGADGCAGARRVPTSPSRSLTLLRRVVRALRATYRLQLGPSSTSPRVASSCPYLRDLGVSHLYLSPSLQARRGSTHGYDVVDPTRVSRRRSAARRACARWPGAGLGDRARHRPQPHGRRRREPLVGRRGAARAVLRLSTRETGWLPALLRHRRPRRRARRGPRGLRASPTARSSSSSRDGRRRRAARRPPRRPRRPGRATCAACASAGVEHVWVEKILAPRRGAARLAGRGHGRLRVPQRRARRCSSTRPARRALTDALRRAHRRDADVRRGRARGPGRAGDDDVRARGRAAALAARRPAGDRGRAGRAAGLPHLRRAVDRARGGRRPRGRRGGRASTSALRRRAPARASAATTSSSRASSRPRRR